MTPEERKAYDRAYYQSHREEKKARVEVYRQAHKKEKKTYLKAYYQAHREKAKAWCKAYFQAHKEVANARHMLRAARKQGASIGAVDLELIKKRDKMVCGICGKKVRPADLSYDHIIPLSKGGAHATWNLQVAHLSCNCARGPGRTPGKLRLDL